jgi:exopolysaccharide biosynthesis polyprenyl glycosylphosphotransferase
MRRLTLMWGDLVALYAALAAVLWIRYGANNWNPAWQAHVWPFTLLFVLWLVALYIANLYDRRFLRNDRDFYARLAQAMGAAAVVSVAFFYFIPVFAITPKTNLFLFIAVASLSLVGVRWLANRALAGGAKKRLLIVGLNDDSLALARFVTNNPQFGWTVRALVRLGQDTLALEPATGPWLMLDESEDLTAFIRAKRIDTVVISPAAYDQGDLVGMLYGAIAEQVDFASLASFTERVTGTLPLGAISQQWFLENIAENSKKPYETAKRAMDVVVSVMLGIPVLLLTPFIAAAIVAESPGSPIFRNRRTGRGGKPFTMFKFRSMRHDAEKETGAVWAKENDPRVTRVGRFLRKTRLDELPQLWNILRGEMSLVGPRAERPEFDAQLTAQIPFYLERYLTRPGLSGWAQINFPYGSSVADARRKLEYDLYYLKHRTLAIDFEIILKTLAISLRRAGR